MEASGKLFICAYTGLVAELVNRARVKSCLGRICGHEQALRCPQNADTCMPGEEDMLQRVSTHLAQQRSLASFHLFLLSQHCSQLLKHKDGDEIGTGEDGTQPCASLSLPAEKRPPSGWPCQKQGRVMRAGTLKLRDQACLCRDQMCLQQCTCVYVLMLTEFEG